MPASIAHMLISKESRKRISEISEYKEFAAALEKQQVYMELGSLGPDLPYYESMVKAGINLLLDKSDKPMGVDQWSYQLHSKDPNIFPLKMIEIAWRESNLEFEEWEPDDLQKFAFICGFLTHIAADQTIHPIVNKVAGPYYKGGDHREVHRECEVYQDVAIYQKVTGKDLMDERPNRWCDLNPGFGSNTPIWFRYFLQKAFVEAHSVSPSEGNIEDWVDGILFMLRGLNNFGPYVKAAKDYGKGRENAENYKRFYSKPDYEQFFRRAIDLSLVYIKATFKLYNTKNVTEDDRKRFKEVVQNADLTAPLEQDICGSAQKALEQWGNG